MAAKKSPGAKKGQDVASFMRALKHSRKSEVELVRKVVLGAAAGITEHVKWNAPSFCYRGDDRVTLRLQPGDRVEIVRREHDGHTLLVPGPQLIDQHPEIFWGVIASMFVGNLMLLILNIPLVTIFVQMLRIRAGLLTPEQARLGDMALPSKHRLEPVVSRIGPEGREPVQRDPAPGGVELGVAAHRAVVAAAYGPPRSGINAGRT